MLELPGIATSETPTWKVKEFEMFAQSWHQADPSRVLVVGLLAA